MTKAMQQAHARGRRSAADYGVEFKVAEVPLGPSVPEQEDAAEPGRSTPIVWQWATVELAGPHDYITGMSSMALAAPNLGGKSCWYTECRNPSGAPMATAMGPAWADGVRVARKVLGREHLTDIREGLRNAGHPEGRRETPVPGATHVRAVLEMAWQHALEEALEGAPEKVETILDERKLRRWMSRDELCRVEEIGHRMGRHCAMARLQRTWDGWLKRVAATSKAQAQP